MKQIKNTLFVTTEDIYLTLDRENVVAKQKDEIRGRFPLHTLSHIVMFSYAGASPSLMGTCAQKGVSLAFCTPQGRFLARVNGMATGNVLLRRDQYRIADDPERAVPIVRNIIEGKICNQRHVLQRTKRDHGLRVDGAKLKDAIDELQLISANLRTHTGIDELRGGEGAAAAVYFGVLDELFLQDTDTFYFKERTRRPPLDPVNALLSFLYALLSHECASALECAGLDSYVGLLHKDRSGRQSLALDLMEELRPCFADRLAATMINNRIVQRMHFDFQESGAVLLNDEGRKRVLQQWQNKKKEKIQHPYLQEKMQWGIVPHTQAQLLARHIRGDLDGYPPFIWK